MSHIELFFLFSQRTFYMPYYVIDTPAEWKLGALGQWRPITIDECLTPRRDKRVKVAWSLGAHDGGSEY
jgi:hypothetical protein